MTLVAVPARQALGGTSSLAELDTLVEELGDWIDAGPDWAPGAGLSRFGPGAGGTGRADAAAD